MKVNISVDMEHDCPPYATTYRGVEEGTPKILAVLAQEQVCATFFTTGDVARKHPEVVRQIVAQGHELGCHGDTHTLFSKMSWEVARQEIEQSSATLRTFAKVHSFRAPSLDFPPEYVALLRESGYTVDSSQPTIESWYTPPEVSPSLSRIPASVPAWVLRTPPTLLLGKLLCGVYEAVDRPVVLYVHPWEFVDMSQSGIRFRSRLFTGERVLRGFHRLIRHLKARKSNFLRMDDLAAALLKER